MNILFITLIFLTGYIFIQSFATKLSEDNLNTLKKLFLFHIVFGTYFCFFVQGDAVGYWRQAKFMRYSDFVYALTEQQGTYFIYALNYFPSNILNLSYFTGTMLYSLIGFIGMTYFYVIAVELIPNNPQYKGYYLFPFLFFLPNLHFWSCAVGKDALLFFCIAIFTYGFLQPIKRIPMIILGLALAYFIRPHITLFMLLGFGMAYFSGKNVSIVQRILFFGVMIGVSIAILPMVMEFAKIEEASVDSFNSFSESKAALLSRSHTNSAIDISSYPFPLKVFTFLYRPFFFDINGIPALLASFENLLLLLLTLTVIRNKPLQTFRNAPFVLQGMVYFLIIGTLAFSQSLGNVGIMIRMRNMFLPGLIIYIFWHFSYWQSKELESNVIPVS
jgi:hypothetical protein